jgi:iron complex outermembrane receptor protein
MSNFPSALESWRVLRVGFTCVTSLLTTPVWAQTAGQTAMTDAPPSQASPQIATPAQADAGAEVAEVVVTAQRRAETVQQSSLDIQVLGQEQLLRAGVSEVKNLSALAPGLQIAFGGNQTQTFIRGVGDFSSTGLGQSAVSFNIDGVYIADEASVAALYYDLARIEVLKGPQGTLYGRNASAGAINIETQRPIDDFGGYVTVEGGNYDLQHVTAALNVPLTDTLAVRVATQYVRRDGYLSDGSDDDRQKDARLSLSWKPTERFSALVVADYEDVGGIGPSGVLLPRQPGTGPFTGTVNAINNAALQAAADVPAFLVTGPGAGRQPTPASNDALLQDSERENIQRNIAGEFHYDLGVADLDFVPAYRTSNDFYFGYEPGFPFSDQETVRQQSYELRLSKNTSLIKAVAGLYYFDNRQTLDQYGIISLFVPSLNTSLNDIRLGTQSYAAFGQATVSVTDTLRFIGGLRFTSEHKTMDGSRSQRIVNSPVETTMDFDSTAQFNSTTFRTGLEYDLTSVNMLYGTVSTGFKAGGFNTFQSQNGISDVYQPEKLTSFALGVRNLFLDRRLQLNVEAFDWKELNDQQTHLTFDPDGNLQFEVLNAGSAKIYGLDAELVAKPTADDTFSLTGEYLHAQFGDFRYNIPTQNYNPASIGCAAAPAVDSPGFTAIDCSGKPLPRAPRWAGTFGYQHVFGLPGGANLTANLDTNFADQRYLAVDYISSERAPSYLRADVNVTYNSASAKWSVTGFVRNLSNKPVYLGAVEAALAPGITYATVDSPRTYGARVTVNF